MVRHQLGPRFLIPETGRGAIQQIRKRGGKIVHALKRVQTVKMFQQQSRDTNVKNGHHRHLMNLIVGWLLFFEAKNMKFQITIFVG